jgi:hypothetical protein
MIGNRLLNKIECFHAIGMHESERFRVTALNLFHPTASPLIQKGNFYITAQPPLGRGMG